MRILRIYISMCNVFLCRCICIHAIENMMLLLLSSLSSSSCVLYYISTKQKHKTSEWTREKKSFIANKMRSTKLLKIREWSATQTHTHDWNLFNVRQDGDNVRHMHLIDLHLLKHLHHTHLLTHSLARSLARSFVRSFVHHRTPIMSINTNTTNCYIEWWTIKRESCSHILHALYMGRARHGVFCYPMWYCHNTMAVLPSHHILVFINDKRISNSTSTIEPANENKTCLA